MRTRTITVTAVMIALCIAVQFFKVPTFAYSIYVIGGLINLILIIDTLYCGIVSGIIVSAVAPITSFIITGSPVIAAVPMNSSVYYDRKHGSCAFCLVCQVQKAGT